MSDRYQVIWRWRAFLWPFYVCRCEDHDGDLHVVFVGWTPGYFKRLSSDYGLSVVYRWIARLGPLEVRRWVPEEAERTARIVAHNEATR